MSRSDGVGICAQPIEARPSRAAVVPILEAAELPSSDLTDAHMEHFFYCGPAAAPIGLVGVEFCGDDALLRSLAVAAAHRTRGLGAALVARAERHARACGARSVFLLTTTAVSFFDRRGYVVAARDSAPPAVRATGEFANVCPATAVLMVKQL